MDGRDGGEHGAQPTPALPARLDALASTAEVARSSQPTYRTALAFTVPGFIDKTVLPSAAVMIGASPKSNI